MERSVCMKSGGELIVRALIFVAIACQLPELTVCRYNAAWVISHQVMRLVLLAMVVVQVSAYSRKIPWTPCIALLSSAITSCKVGASPHTPCPSATHEPRTRPFHVFHVAVHFSHADLHWLLLELIPLCATHPS